MEIPGSIEQSVITRFKVLARMNIAEHRRPQDGTFSIKYNDKMYDFRINTLPVSGKEKVVIRILAPAVSLKTSGDVMMIGAYTGYFVLTATGPTPLGLVLAFLGAMVVCAVLSIAIERCAYRPLRTAPRCTFPGKPRHLSRHKAAVIRKVFLPPSLTTAASLKSCSRG